MHYSEQLYNKSNLPNSNNRISTEDELLSEWSLCINESVEMIELLKSNAEKEMLSIGTSLYSFHSSAKDITNLSISTVNSLMGEAVKGNIDELSNIVNRAGLFISKSDQEIDNSKNILIKIGELLSSAIDSLHGFNRIIKYLRTLGISTKIENSRLNNENTGFHVLAENVENLSNIIADKVTSIKGKASSLYGTVMEMLTVSSTLQNKNHLNTQSIFENVKLSLDSLTVNYDLCLSKAKTVSQHSETMTGNINGIVVSVQFHDIISQQLEHIKEAFDALSEEIHLAGNKTDTASRTEILGTIFEIGRIQAAQLKHSRDEFYKACQEIIFNLSNVYNTVSQILDEIQTTHELINSGSVSSLAVIEKEIDAMKDLLIKNTSSSRDFLSSVDIVVETVKGLSDYISEVEEIGTEIEMVAMNAQVKAAHTGKEGAALGVIAETIQKLSFESKEQTSNVASFLEHIVNIVNELTRERSGFAEEENNSASMIEKLNSSSNSIKELKTNIAGMTGKIKMMVEYLHKDIDKCVSGINIHNNMNIEINRVTNRLDVMIDQLAKLGISHTHKTSKRLKDLEEKYTMHSERHVHDKITLKPNKNIAGNLSVEDDSIDDNIELF